MEQSTGADRDTFALAHRVALPLAAARGRLYAGVVPLQWKESNLDGDSSRMPRLTDSELVTRCLSGDKAAWTALLQRYERLIYVSLLVILSVLIVAVSLFILSYMLW